MAEPIRADSVRPERVKWLWRDRIPCGMITIAAGRPDQGKGLFVAHVAAEVSRMKIATTDGGWRWGKVLYSAIEDSHTLMTVPRLIAANAKMDNIFLWDSNDPLKLPNNMHALERFVVQKKIDLIVLDPFAAHLGGGVSRHSDNIREVLTPLKTLLERTRCATIVVEHVLKRFGAHAHPLASIGGSGSGLPAASRAAFLFGTDPDDDERRVLASVKFNCGEMPSAIAFQKDTAELDEVGEVPFLLFEDEINFDPIKLVVTDRKRGTVGRPPDKRAAAAEWLTNYLVAAGGKAPASKIFEDAKHYGMTAKTLRNARIDMHLLTDPPGGGNGCKWELPPELMTLITPPVITSAEDGEESASLLSDETLDLLLGYGKEDEEGGE